MCISNYAQKKQFCVTNEATTRDLLQLRPGYRMWVIYGSATHISRTHTSAAGTFCTYQTPQEFPPRAYSLSPMLSTLYGERTTRK